ncbi:AraC family transcriptional regulator [Pseudarthrobacter sp. NPDC058196]|uniref:helix-turn-helix transcriptional regulator n=1 Tax=Pseudarthrobacter sp. NPDC058196 TaxID=3346376 RepID=UPI0036D92329
MTAHGGFPGQRLRVLPRPMVRTALGASITGRLLVTDAGHFPRAAGHLRMRPRGAEESIIVVCAAGAGQLEAGGGPPIPVTGGQAFVIPAGTAHRYAADGNDPWSIWWLHVSGPDADEMVGEIARSGSEAVFALRDVYSAIDLINDTLGAMERDDARSSLLLASGSAWRLLAVLASDRLRGPAASRDRIGIVQDHLRGNLRSNAGAVELARLAGLSVSHFSALFKAATGMGLVEYTTRLRCARARELLLTTDATVADIAATVGYTDTFYFSRKFKAVSGVSPREFRRRERLNWSSQP